MESCCSVAVHSETIVAAISVVVALVAVVISVKALKENRRATHAQTFFEIQRFGFEVAQSRLDDPHFKRYLRSGIASVPREARGPVVRKFAALLSAYDVIAFQHHFGNLDGDEWDSFEKEFRSFVQSEGAKYYFRLHPIETSLFDQRFKALVTRLRNQPSGDPLCEQSVTSSS